MKPMETAKESKEKKLLITSFFNRLKWIGSNRQEMSVNTDGSWEGKGGGVVFYRTFYLFSKMLVPNSISHRRLILSYNPWTIFPKRIIIIIIIKKKIF